MPNHAFRVAKPRPNQPYLIQVVAEPFHSIESNSIESTTLKRLLERIGKPPAQTTS